MPPADPTPEISPRFVELAKVLDRMPAGIAIAEAPGGRLIYHNDEAERLLGHPVMDVESVPDYGGYGAIHADGSPYRPEEYPIVRALEGAPVDPEEMLYVRGDGSRTWLLVNAAPIRDEAGRLVKAISAFFDISEQKRTEQRLADAEAKLRLAVDIAGIGFWEWDVAGERIYYSAQWKRHLGYEDDELPNTAREWRMRLHPDDHDRVVALLDAHVKNPSGGDYQATFRLRHRDGNYRWIEARGQMFLDAHGMPSRMIGTHLDISEHRMREEQVRLAAQHDRLTGLPNRALLMELTEHWLSVAQRTGKMFAVLFIDLDEFKPINDVHGHHVGDQVLQEVALRLRSSFRSHDILSRLGGDEFVVVVTQLDSTLGAAHAAAHALRQLSLPYRIGNLVLQTTPSIGISLFPQNGADVSTLLQCADNAMYAAKERGKAGFRFYMQDSFMVPDSVGLAHDLRESFLRGALQLHFQPIVDVQAQRLLGVEALLRWPGSGGAYIPPDIFIPIAEQNGFIVELDAWVFAEACAQHQRWRAAGLPAIDIGINLSAMQFRDLSLIDSIQRCVADTGVDPRYLWLEISDRAFTGQLDHALLSMQRLKLLGLRITLDDFGAGYSSLEQLSRLPIDRMKIDRSLIATLGSNRTSLAVTEAAIVYGNTLGIEVIAEGLETYQMLGFLKDRHCHRAQGYYFSPAMPAPQFAQWYGHAGLH